MQPDQIRSFLQTPLHKFRNEDPLDESGVNPGWWNPYSWSHRKLANTLAELLDEVVRMFQL